MPFFRIEVLGMQNSSSRASIIMIGGPNAGKSHYTFQLFGRLSESNCELKLRAMPNLGLFKEGLEQLNNGLPAEHTSLDKYENADLRLEDLEGREFDLLWPDYGGEQIRQILQHRGVDEAWKLRLEEAEGLLLFVRLHELVDYKNIVEHPLAIELEQRSHLDKHTEPDLSSQVGIIEMLQMVMWSTRKHTSSRMVRPKLGILLTCWDELGVNDVEPKSVLIERAPLLEQFIRGNWHDESVFVIGLSSLERPLDPRKSDEEFISKGPESFGYIIQPDGMRNADLTWPLSRMIEFLNEYQT
jgi:hypothetical protein